MSPLGCPMVRQNFILQMETPFFTLRYFIKEINNSSARFYVSKI